MNTFFKKILIPFSILLFASLWMFFLFSKKSNEVTTPQKETRAGTQKAPMEVVEPTKKETPQPVTESTIPLTRAEARVTKKPFGIFINPKTSPVQPERFSGFHTGTDFEIFPKELNETVEVLSICEGEIIQKKYVNGYGGVIIQNCTLSGKPVTVLYGHLDLQRSAAKIDEYFKKNEPIAVLADDKSYYTAGERKHLHLGIHNGTSVELRGYVQTKNQLESWFDFEKIFPGSI